jgi:hypothetical protein
VQPASSKDEGSRSDDDKDIGEKASQRDEFLRRGRSPKK